ncbi:MAG: sulfurtransferase complex subunit TusC [Halieaceae bacterium]|nr:sulfurtransferase complex subunit TusC [Halieaceae bacterium]MCP5186564.1 sulfurtransferase complex subunit TusC [Pseudomonadales bacterium]
MVEPATRSTLAVIRHAPYGSSLARAAIDVSLANAAFDQPVELLFMGDGVLQLLPAQDAAALGRKNLARLLASLPLYGIEQVYVDAESAARYRVDLAQSPVAAVPLEATALRALLREHDQLLGF